MELLNRSRPVCNAAPSGMEARVKGLNFFSRIEQTLLPPSSVLASTSPAFAAPTSYHLSAARERQSGLDVVVQSANGIPHWLSPSRRRRRGIAAVGMFAIAPLFWTLPTAFLSDTAAAGGIALINSIGNLAGFVAP